MSFQSPFFLFALLAIFLPVLIHLFDFRITKRIAFTNVRFLKEVKQQKREGARVKNRLVLASRILSVLFLVLAFAQPYIPSTSGAAKGGSQKVLLYVDNSQSMSGLGSEGALLDQAIQKARKIVDDFELNDRFMLLTNDFSGAHRRWVNRNEFNNLLDKVTLTSKSSDFREIQMQIEQVFSDIPKANTQVFILSDFQKSFVTTDSLRIDTNIRLNVLPFRTHAIANLSIDSIWLLSPIISVGDIGKLVVQLSNYSDKDANNVSLKLYLDEMQKTIGKVSVSARSSARDTLVFRTEKKGWHAGEIRLNDYPLTFDDRFYFSYKTADSISVLLVKKQDTISYLNYLFSEDKIIDLKVNNATSIDFGELKSSNLVILNGLDQFSSGLIMELNKFVEGGGSLAIFPNMDVDISAYNQLLRALQTDVFTGTDNRPNRISKVNYKHAIFSGVFENIPQNPDMPSVNKYFTLSSGTRTRKRAIMTMHGGHALLNEYILGRGHVFLFTVPLQVRYSNLPLHAVFVPLMYRMVLLSSDNDLLYHKITKDRYVIMQGLKAGAEPYHLKAENFDVIPDLQNKNGIVTLYLADQIDKPGNYSLQLNNQQKALLSFNENKKESDLSYLSDQELKNLFSGYEASIMDKKAQLSESFNVKATFGTQLWKYCLILALIFMAAEILLIRAWPNVNT